MRHLDEKYERGGGLYSNDFIEHFHDTIRICGGVTGLILLGLASMAFYAVVLYTISTGRERRRKAINRK